MLVIRVWGGIGNQLFQYAFGEYLRLKTKQDVYYDVLSFGSSDKLRKLELGILNSDIPIVEDIKFSRYTCYKNRFYGLLFRLNPHNKFILEQNFNLETIQFKNNNLYYLQGYWQSSIYPDELQKIDKEIFTPKQDFPVELRDVKNDITSTQNTVSLHVRRGDYFLPKNIGIFGVCDVSYYHRALDLLRNRCDDIKFFVFSDDLEWVQNNLSLPINTVLVSNYEVNPYWYIHLMSQCKHNIISNSSFSWWGAYLNRNNDKTVTCPSKWTLNSDKTIALQEWVKIDV
jgi:hypothetical protein